MKLKRNFTGIIVANLTPFNPDGSIDEGAYRAHIEFLIEKGVHGLFPIGTMGEGINIALREKKKIVDILVDQIKDRIDIMVQGTCSSTLETIEFAKYCELKGVHALALITPWFYPYDDESLYKNFASIAKAVPKLPIFIYNNPGRSTNKISIDLYKRLVNNLDNIIGIKDSSQDIGLFEEYIKEVPEEYIAIIGSDGLFFPALEVGAKGIVTAIANSHPEIFVELWNEYNNGHIEKAKEIQDDINKMRKVFKIGPYVSAYKYAIKKRGISFGGFNLPIRDLEEKELLEFETAYKEADFIRKWER